MNTQVATISGSIVKQLSTLESSLDKQIQELQHKKQALHQTVLAFGSKPVVKPVAKPVAKKTAPAQAKGGESSMEMARQVLRNHGSEMEFKAVREQIRKDFGVEPVQSLQQMLYKRSRSGAGFYRLPDGKYGLNEWRNKEKKAA